MTQGNGDREKNLKILIGAVVVSAVAAVMVAALLVTIAEHKYESVNPFYRVVELTDETQDPAIWGKNFPLQYDSYLKTVDQVRTHFGGSEAEPRTPTAADPRSFVSQSKIEEDPRLKTIWAGYGFSKDFREERGHAYMLEDQTYTLRQQAGMPGTCIHCHASTYVPYKKAGDGDLIKGFEKVNPLPYFEIRQLFTFPVSCIDCHEPTTMQLRVTRPGFLEGIAAYKEAVEGIKGYDVNRNATHQEMRTYVCAQCHVEYYFKGKEKRLVYPWTNGLKGDEILAYYDELEFKDWTHKDTGTPALKAQHPEFEMWSQGIHARSGVSCADCHMPYMRVGAMKVSDHHVRSPLLNVNRACQTCHRWSEDELKARVFDIQDRVYELREVAMNAVVELIGELKAAKEAGRDDAKFREAQMEHRRAQFLLDFVEAENSTGFHAPMEAERLLAHAIDRARQGQLLLR